MKKRILIILLFVFIISIASVSASEDVNQTNEKSSDIISISPDEDIINATDGGTFTDLQEKIDNAQEGSIINLENDYKYNEGFNQEGIVISKNLTINGNGHKIDGNFTARIFYIGGSTTGIVLNNIGFLNGFSNYVGGAIFIENGINTFYNCTFINNIANQGGAIGSMSKYDTINNCIFKSNVANYGGALFLYINSAYGPVNYAQISNSYFVDNFANEYGGAIFNYRDSTIIDSHFDENYAEQRGGAIYTSNGFLYYDYINIDDILYYPQQFKLNISGQSSFNNNNAYYGSAIYVDFLEENAYHQGKSFNENGILILNRGVVFESNFAVQGTLYLNSTNTTITGVRFINNRAIVFDTIYSYSNSTLTIDKSLFINNTANMTIASVYADKNLNLTKSIFEYPVSTPIVYYYADSEDDILNGQLYLDNNEMICDNSYDIRYESNMPMAFKTKLVFENKTVLPNETVKLCELQDNKGNTIMVSKVLDPGINVRLTNVDNPEITDTAILEFDEDLGGYLYYCNLEDGVYKVTGSVSSEICSNCKVIDGYLTISSLNLYVPNVTKDYGGPEKLEITLTEMDSPVANANVNVNIGDVIHTVTTNSNGKAYLPLDLDAGTYQITVFYGKYAQVPVTVTVNQLNTKTSVKVTLDANNVTLTATIDSSTATGNVEFNVNGFYYTRKISNGEATLKLTNLKPNTYTVKATYNGDTNHKTSMSSALKFNIEARHVNIVAPDVTKNYGGNEKLVITLTNQDSTSLANTKLKITLANETYTKTTDKNGRTLLDLDLNAGSYDATIVFEGNDEYEKATAVSKITVNKLSTKTSLKSANNTYNNFTLTVTLDPSTVTGNVVFNVNGKDYTKKISDGKVTLKLTNLEPNTYTVKATYNGDANHMSSSKTISFDVEEIKYDISAPDLTKYYHGHERFVVTVKEDNNPIVGKNVTITLKGIPYIRTTNSNGQASIGINLNSGKYGITSEFEGIEVKSTITVKSTVSGKDISKIFRNGTQYYATFVDTGGNLLKNTAIKFNINGVFYTRTTNDEGVARMNINLNPGEYIITAENPNSGEQYSNLIKVLPCIVEVHDLTKFYKNASRLTFKLLDDQGRPVGAGVAAKININGVFYERKTNASGYVNMNINLNPGTYIATLEYKGLMASSTVKVLPILEAKDVNMRYRDGTKFEVKLLDGQGKPFAGQTITLNINGVLYNRVTNENGFARLNLNLMAGEYIITSMYENGAAISNKVTIRG